MLGNRCDYYVLGGDIMKQFIKDVWEAIKIAKEVRAKAVIAGAHWY